MSAEHRQALKAAPRQAAFPPCSDISEQRRLPPGSAAEQPPPAGPAVTEATPGSAPAVWITSAGTGSGHAVPHSHGGHVPGDAFAAADLAPHAGRRTGAAPPPPAAALAPRQPFPGRKLAGMAEGDSVPSIFIPRPLDLHAQGHLSIEKIVTPRPFGKTSEAACRAESGDLVKPVVVMA